MKKQTKMNFKENRNMQSEKCLNIVFDDSQSRRKYFIDKLRDKINDDKIRNIKGFPLGSDEDILELSDPPYYTACPNPFLKEFVNFHVTNNESTYTQEPYSGELKSSTRHPIKSFHPYHTSVPPEVIQRLIEHYTEPGDLVFDGFCGTGMTGVGALESGRNAILCDLSPVATFISGVNTIKHNWQKAKEKLEAIIEDSRNKYGYLYETIDNNKKLTVNYYVWSDVFTCPDCVHEFPIFPHGVKHNGKKVSTLKSFPCPSCGTELNVRRIERVIVYEGKKKVLVWVNAGKGKRRINRKSLEYDIELANSIEDMNISDWYPVDKIDPDGYTAKLAQLGDKAITDVSKFLSKRNLIVFSDLWRRVKEIEDIGIRHLCRATLSSVFTIISERQGYFGGGGGMSGNLYMPIVRMEKNVYDVLHRKINKMVKAEQVKKSTNKCITTTQSTTDLNIPGDSIDYIYTDPPFGANIIYSEMNLILEAWLRVKTNSGSEAVIDESRNLTFEDYAGLMYNSFSEYYRVLKPGRWMTVEFHNTKASVWNLIQNALGESGFIVAQVDVFDKGSTTILGDIRPGAAVQDLLITVYKPTKKLEERFKLDSGSEEGVWDFVRSHLNKLPLFNSNGGKVEMIPQRQSHLLYDRMVAFHVQRGVTVPISAGEFYKGLDQRFILRDSMYFLPNQAADYDKKRMKIKEIQQMQLFVSDEASAIQWLKQQLSNKPQTFQELHPKFLKEIGGWQKHEKPLELLELLEQNFLRYDGKKEVPSQIHSYLSTNYKDMRNKEKLDSDLIEKAKDRWYVPDPNKLIDLEKLREKALLREFEEYKNYDKRKLEVFRLEAVRTGFKKAWLEHDYDIIIDVADKIPEDVLLEDPKLLMWYDQAITRSES